MCHSPKCKCQKQITFAPKHFQLASGSIKNKLQKNFRGTQSAWNKFLKPAQNIAIPYIGMAVAAKTKSAEVGQATSSVLKNISGGKKSSLTDLHGIGIRIKIM